MADELAVSQPDGNQGDTPPDAESQNSGTPDHQAQLQERDSKIAKLEMT